MRSDSYGWIWNGLVVLERETGPWQELDWWVGSMWSDSSGSGTGTYVSESDRCGWTQLWIPGLSLLGGLRDFHCLAEPGPWQLGGLRDFHCLAEPGPWQLGGLRDPDRNWTGESDRCDRTRLDPELELMFLSRTDVVGLSCGSGTFTAWRTPGLFTAWRNRELDSLADSGTFTDWRTPGLSLLGGTGTLTAWRTPGPWQELDWWVGSMWSDSSGSGTGTYVSESDRCGRTQLWIRDFHCLADSGTFTAWRNRDLDSLADSGTFTAWRNRDLDSLADSGTLTGTGLVSRIDVIGLVWIRNWNLCFWVGPMWLDSVVDPGLSLLGGTPGLFTAWRNRDLDSLAHSGTFTAWRTPGLLLLGGTGTLTAWRTPGPWQELDWWVGSMWSDSSGSGTGTYVSESDRCGRTQLWIRDFHCLADSGTFTAWRNRDLDSLADSGTFTAWRNRDLDSLADSGTLTGTGLVSRIDVIGLVWIRNWNLCFWVGPMWLDSVVDPGLSLLGGIRDSSLLGETGTLTAWRTPGLSLLGGLRDSYCLAEPGPWQLGGLRDFHWNWNSRGRTVQNNTPCCGSRPPAYPSFYTDEHVFLGVSSTGVHLGTG